MSDYLGKMTDRQRAAYFDLSRNYEQVIGIDLAHGSVCDHVLTEIDQGDLREESVVALAKIGYHGKALPAPYYAFLHALHALGLELTDPAVVVSGINYHLRQFHQALKNQQSN